MLSSIRLSPMIFLALVLAFAGCGGCASKRPGLSSTPVRTATAAGAAADAHVVTIASVAAQAATYCDVTGRALLESIEKSAAAAMLKLAVVEAELDSADEEIGRLHGDCSKLEARAVAAESTTGYRFGEWLKRKARQIYIGAALTFAAWAVSFLLPLGIARTLLGFPGRAALHLVTLGASSALAARKRSRADA